MKSLPTMRTQSLQEIGVISNTKKATMRKNVANLTTLGKNTTFVSLWLEKTTFVVPMDAPMEFGSFSMLFTILVSIEEARISTRDGLGLGRVSTN